MNKEDLIYVSDEEKFYDYCHREYSPINSLKNKLSPINILFKTFEIMNCGKEYYKLVYLLRKKLGKNNIVWGFKKEDNNYSWEFYFYNWYNLESNLRFENIIKIIKPFINCDLKLNENYIYLMFSFDVNDKLIKTKNIEEIDLYNGPAYVFNKSGFELKNTYDFYYLNQNNKNNLLSDIKRSCFIDFSKIKLNEILWPGIMSNYCICRSRKRKNDAIYFQRLNLNQTIFFIKKLEYPVELIEFFENNYSKLDYLLTDVGYDYNMVNEKIKVIKSGFYGTF